MNSLPNAMAVVLNENQVIVRCNANLLLTTNYSEYELIGEPASTLFNPEQFMPLGREANNRSEHHQPYQLQVKTANGTLLETDTIVMELQTNRAKLLFLYVMCVKDLTLKQKVFQQFAVTYIREENHGVVLLDAFSRILQMSPLAEKVLASQGDKWVGMPMHQIMAHLPAERKIVTELFSGGNPVRNHAFTWEMDGEKCAFLMDAHLLRDEEEKIIGAYVLFKNISDLRSLEEQVQRGDRLKMIGEIAAGVAHEIRNPLTAIKGFLQILKKTMETNSFEKEYGYTDIMLLEINRINHLVNEFLLLSKPKDTVYEVVDLSEVMEELMPIVNSEALLCGVDLWYEGVCELPRILADREMLKQVFLNLCKNGIEAITDGGSLTIDCRAAVGTFVEITIRDSGIGIPDSVIDRIFDPFVTTKTNGTGLGLSVCQRIVHDLGGYIKVVSNEEGSAFTVYLPIPEESSFRDGPRTLLGKPMNSKGNS
jgi:two-component system, sporulation sensor kinase E